MKRFGDIVSSNVWIVETLVHQTYVTQHRGLIWQRTGIFAKDALNVIVEGAKL